MPLPQLVAAIDGLPPAAFTGTAFRHQPPQYDPLSGRGARIMGGRWNPPDSFSVLYLGLDRTTVVNEFARAARRQRREVADFLPRTLFGYELGLTNLLDLRGHQPLAAVDLTPEDIRSDNLDRCQQVGHAAHHAGREGILAPSAAGPGTVLALFPDPMDPGSSVQPRRLEHWEDAEDVPR